MPLAAIGAGLCAVAAGSARAAQPEVRIGSAPVLPAGTRLVAGTAAVRTIGITVALAPRDPVALTSYASAVSNPNSPDYRHYLTPREFRARFAAARSTVLRVQAELRAHGLHPGAVTANGLAIHIRASGAAIEHAFALTLVPVRLANGRDAFYNSRAPAVDASVAPDIQAIIGLSSVAEMRRLDLTHAATNRGPRTHSGHVVTGGPQPCLKASEVAPGQGAYTADQIATAYGFSSVYGTGDLGQGVTIGVYELEPNSLTDVAAYQKCYGTDTTVSYVKIDGGAGKGIGQGEAALDIEQLIGLAPKAKLIVYQGPNNNSDNPGTGPYDTLLAMINRDQVQVISNSWGECETLEGSTDAHAENTLFQEAAIQGQTFATAAGDSGSTDCWQPPPGGNTNNSLSVDDPASQPFVTAVGGTSLTQTGPPATETVWDDDNPNINYARFGIQQGAGGGGISSFWPMPSFQTGAVPGLGVVSAVSSAAPCAAPTGSYCREVPDVSADADPLTSYLTYWNGAGTVTRAEAGWQGTGGTSGAAPVWAALFALADASRACAGTSVGFANPTMYALAGQSQATYFNDITSGNNDFTPSGNTSGLYAAAPGYDMASGLGSPKAATLVPALCQQAVKVTYPGAIYTFYGQHTRLAMHAALAAGQTGTITFHARRLPLGLHLNRATGVISGRVRSAGVHAVSITASSSSGSSGSIHFTWAVERRPKVSATVVGTESAQVLTIRASSGAYEPGLRELSIVLPRSIKLSGARSVQVLSLGGRRLAHSAHLSGRVLTIKLQVVHSPVRIVFPSGSLHVRGSLRRAGSIAVLTVDRVGGHLTLKRAIGV